MAENHEKDENLMKITLEGTPITKKNHSRIVRLGNGRRALIPSKRYQEYEAQCIVQLLTHRPMAPIDRPVNVRCVYYMDSRRRVDLNNLLEASTDILVRAGILADDNSKIVAGHDGSRVRYDRQHPRAEITITEMEMEEHS